MQARCSLAGNLYNDFHLLLFGGSWDRETGLSRLSPWTASFSSSCASCSPFAFHLRHGYREGGIQRYIAEEKQKPSRRRRVRRPPPSRSTTLATSFSLALPLSRGWHRPPAFPLSASVALARAVSRVRRTPRIARDDLMPRRPAPVDLQFVDSRYSPATFTKMRYKFVMQLVRGIRTGE